MRQRIIYSQNFLKNPHHIAKLIGQTSIDNTDVVLDIGAGSGIITQELTKVCHRVIAFELDQNLSHKLSQQFQDRERVEIQTGDFLKLPLPTYPYKVFSNIPFKITSSIINKLTQATNPPIDAYFTLQKEAAKKTCGRPFDSKNSLLATRLKPWFDMSIIHNFHKDDFFPQPMVDVVLVRLNKKLKPTIRADHRQLYEDFVSYAYSQFQPNIVRGLAKVLSQDILIKLSKRVGFNPNSKPSELDDEDWLGIFDYFINNCDVHSHKIVQGFYDQLLTQQQNLQKIHRSRLDPNWKQQKN